MVGEGEAVGAGVYDVEVVEAQVGQGAVHRLRRGWPGGAFDLEPQDSSADLQPQVEFGAAVGRPVGGVGRGESGQELFEDHALPAGAEHRRALEVDHGGDAQQRVQKARVADVDPGRFHLAL